MSNYKHKSDRSGTPIPAVDRGIERGPGTWIPGLDASLGAICAACGHVGDFPHPCLEVQIKHARGGSYGEIRVNEAARPGYVPVSRRKVAGTGSPATENRVYVVNSGYGGIGTPQGTFSQRVDASRHGKKPGSSGGGL